MLFDDFKDFCVGTFGQPLHFNLCFFTDLKETVDSPEFFEVTLVENCDSVRTRPGRQRAGGST